jgi:hypothetical protein
MATKLIICRFNKNYYRFCPILNTDMDLRSLYKSSPTLFWTIIIISVRWHPKLHGMTSLLTKPYNSLLGETLVGPITSIESIQAIVLICYWPLSIDKQLEDPSWNYCGLATHAATRLRLNRVDNLKKDRVSVERRKTWLACVKLNCRLVTDVSPTKDRAHTFIALAGTSVFQYHRKYSAEVCLG